MPTWTVLPTAGNGGVQKEPEPVPHGFTSYVGSGAASALRPGNLVLYLSTKYPRESLEMDFCKCRTPMCKLNTFFNVFSCFEMIQNFQGQHVVEEVS